MSKKRIMIVVMTLIIIIIVYIFRPISFNKEFFDTNKISVTYVVNSMKDGTIIPEFKTLTFNYKSDDFHQIENIIEKYPYHRCLKTWINKGQLSGMRYLLSNDERTMVITENSYIEIDSKIYRVGYWGNSKAKKMIEELKDILEY